ncbi:hypothetical protein [Bradyrhizobium cenepequi]
MSTTSVTALDHTIQEANIWLKAIDEQLDLDSPALHCSEEQKRVQNQRISPMLLLT